jgi:hypothetical protein
MIYGFSYSGYPSDDDKENLDISANAVQTRPRAKVSHVAHFTTIISQIFSEVLKDIAEYVN